MLPLLILSTKDTFFLSKKKKSKNYFLSLPVDLLNNLLFPCTWKYPFSLFLYRGNFQKIEKN